MHVRFVRKRGEHVRLQRGDRRTVIGPAVTIGHADHHAAARQRPEDSPAVYQRAAAARLLTERQVALESLQRQGVLTLDVPANQLSTAVINRYLELKGQTLL